MELFILIWLLGYLVSLFIMFDHIVISVARYDYVDHNKMKYNKLAWWINIILANLIHWPVTLRHYWQHKDFYTRERAMMRFDEQAKTR